MSGMPKRATTSVLPLAKSKKQKFDDNTRREKVLIARNKLQEYLGGFERDDTLADGPGVAMTEEVGAISFKSGDKKVVCGISLMRDMLQNDEIENNPDSTSDAKEIMEDTFAPVSKFAENLELLAAKLLEGAALARASGLDNVSSHNATDDTSEEEAGDNDDAEDDAEDDTENDAEDDADGVEEDEDE
ncbi:hypothetical protein T484DRAFT_1750260 [Baffinella frigidus]|nr:hypothetical protein T484DRAFT_1750260 [Cryptophyta sp. CCMP2293]